MSSDLDEALDDLISNMIPLVKRRVMIALGRSREDVEFEILTLASLYGVRNGLAKP